MSVDALVAERAEARKRGDFKRADEIRAELEAQGYELRDRKDGSTRLMLKVYRKAGKP